MISVEELPEMVISKKLQPVISKSAYEEKAKEQMPKIKLTTGNQSH